MSTAISQIGLVSAFAAGVISFLSPCVLPLVPGYISYVSGATINETKEPSSRLFVLLLGACFVLGFSTIFIALGATATALSRVLLSYKQEANLIGGAVVIGFGLFMTGLVRLPWLQRDVRFHSALKGGHPTGAYLLGLAFAFGWTPCIGPVLGAILTVSALSSTAASGIILLSVYSIGLGVPFLLSALFAGGLARRLAALRRTGRVLRFLAGVIMVAVGAAMITGTMATMSFWLLETFPALSRIG